MPTINPEHGITCWEKFSVGNWIEKINEGNTVTENTIQRILGEFAVEGDISPLIAALINTRRLTSVITVNNFSILYLSPKKISVFIAALKTADHLASVVTLNNISSILCSPADQDQVKAFITALKTAGHLTCVITTQNLPGILRGGNVVQFNTKRQQTKILNALESASYLVPSLVNAHNFISVLRELPEETFSILLNTLKAANHLKIAVNENNFNAILNELHHYKASALVDVLEAANQLIYFITAENFKHVLNYLSADKIPDLIAALKTADRLGELVNSANFNSIFFFLGEKKTFFAEALETANHLVGIVTDKNIISFIYYLPTKKISAFIAKLPVDFCFDFEKNIRPILDKLTEEKINVFTAALEKLLILPEAEKIEDFKKCVILRLKIIDKEKFRSLIYQIKHLRDASAIREANYPGIKDDNRRPNKLIVARGCQPAGESVDYIYRFSSANPDPRHLPKEIVVLLDEKGSCPSNSPLAR